MATPVQFSQFRAVLFDLDGVLTQTDSLHRDAWRALFVSYFAEYAPSLRYEPEDYFLSLDGKPRYEGVQRLLAAKGIQLDWGSASDPSHANTVCGLGNRKNEVFNELLHSQGIQPYPGSLRFLDWLAGTALQAAVVSSSKNARPVLAAAGIADRFEVVIDGLTAVERHIPGKPAPDMYLSAASSLEVSVAQSVVIEDAVSGVQAGAAGGFFTVGVDRGAGAELLLAAGANLVVSDLEHLIPRD